MSVHTVFEYDASDHYQASRAVTRHTSTRYFVWGMAAVALALLVWNIGPMWSEYPLSTLFWSGLPYLLLGVFWVMFLPLMQRRAAKRLPEVDASVKGPQERTIDVDGYHSRGNGVSIDVPWHAMVRGVETDRYFLFFYNKQYAYYLPKRVLEPPQIVTVRELMQAGLGSRAQVRPA